MSRIPLLHTLRGHGAAVRAVAVTADGTRAVSGSDDTTLKVWDLERGKELATLAGHSAAIRTVAITPDGRWAVSGSEDTTLKVWDLERGEVHATLTGHAGVVWSVAIAPDRMRALSGAGDEPLKIWDIERGEEIRSLIHGSSVWAVAVAPDGRHAVSGAGDGTIRLWDLDSGAILTVFRRSAGIQAVAIVRGMVEFDSRGWQPSWEQTGFDGFTILSSSRRALVVTPDGKHIVGADYRLQVWGPQHDRIRAAPTGHTHIIWALAVTPDGRRAVTGAGDGTIEVWELEHVPDEDVYFDELAATLVDDDDATRSIKFGAVADEDWIAMPAGVDYDATLLIPDTVLLGRGIESLPAYAEPPNEPVRFGASAPRRVRPGQEFTARLASYNQALLRQAKKALRQPNAKTHENLAETSWQAGVKARVTLTGAHLSVEPAAQEFVWEGKIHVVNFDVRVRPDIEEDTDTQLKFDVFVVNVPGCEAVPVASVRLHLEIRRKRDWLGRPLAIRIQFAARPAFQTAFASYHHADGANVLTRLDAIQQHTGMKFFHECLSVHPRAERKPLVTHQIIMRDLFMLFWSRRAESSPEVEFEWRTALEYKGLGAMQAQRLEREPLLPPELESLDRATDGQNLPGCGLTRKSKILFLAASPVAGQHRALDREAREIEAKIQAAAHRDALVFQTRWAVRPDDLLQALNQDRPAVVHFSGHAAGERGIALHDDAGAAKLVTAEALQRLFRALQGDIRLVVLNACYSHEQATAVAEVIDCVIGMSDRIGDQAARAFAASFYRALGFGRSIRNAFEQGLVAIALERLEAEHVPRLLARVGVDPDHVYIVTGPDRASLDPMGADVRAEP
jgi:hypothetical protein